MAQTRRLAWAALVVVGALGVLTVLLSGGLLDSGQKQVLSDSAFVMASLAAFLAAADAARRTSGRLRRAWVCLAATGACWFVGNVIWFHDQLIADSQPFPSFADPFYITALLFGCAGLLLIPVFEQRRGDRLRVALDALVVAGSLLWLSWALVLGRVFEAGGQGLARVVVLTYPLGDILLGALAVVLLARAGGTGRRDLSLLAAAFFVYSLSDTNFALLGAQGTFQIGSAADLGWIAGYLLLVLAAVATSDVGAAVEGPLRRRRSGAVDSSLLVYLPLALAVALHTVVNEAVSEVPLDLISGSVVLLFLLRQALLGADNLALRRGLEDKVAERTGELERLARQSELILDSVAEGIYGVDLEGRIAFVNPAAARMLGYDPGELLGEQAHARFHRSDGTSAAGSWQDCHVTAALREGAYFRGSDELYVRKDGSTFPVELTASPMQGSGHISGAVVAFSDITKRREVERIKDEFVSVVSHELRTPLTSIRGSLGLLAGAAVGELPDRAARMVRIALDNCDRLTRLINDILDIERIKSGAIPLQVRVCDAEELVRATITALQPVATTAGVRLIAGPAGGHVHADPDRIAQALTNLVSNAIKFSPPGAQVSVEARSGRDEVTFGVADKGRGIPAEKLETIFERFEQVDSSDAREKGGTGLGLAISRSIVERHGGRIWAESRPGEGALFQFTLRAVSPPSAPGGDGTPAEDRPRVLVCDDDPDVLAVLDVLLREHGYAPTTVSRAEEAVRMAAREHPDVVLLDLRMPGMTGWEALSALKRGGDTCDIPVVVLSALSPVSEPELAGRVEGWVTKPVDEEEMERALRHALRGEQRRPTVLVVEDDTDLTTVLVSIFERRGLRVVSAATEREAVERSREVQPDALVLDLHLLNGDGYGVVEALRHDGRMGKVPVIVYSAEQVDRRSRERLRLGEMVFLTKGRDTPADLEERVVAVVGRVAGRTERSQDHARSVRAGG